MKGDDAVKLLQGLTTRDVTKPFSATSGQSGSLDANSTLVPAISTFILNSRGRVLFDAIISRASNTGDNDFRIECAADLVDALIEHLGRYKLRNKVTMSKEVGDSVHVFHVLPRIDPETGEADTAAASRALEHLTSDQSLDIRYYSDPRIESFGYRLYISPKSVGQTVAPEERKLQLLHRINTDS